MIPKSYSIAFIAKIQKAAKDPQTTYQEIARRFHIHVRSVSMVLGRRKPGPRTLVGLKRVEDVQRILSMTRLRSKTGQFLLLLFLLQGCANFRGNFRGAPPPVTIVTRILPVGSTGIHYSQPLTVSGGKPPYTWSQPAVIAGFTLSTSGVIDGASPSVLNTFFPVTVKDSKNKSSSKNFQFAICAPLGIPGQTLPPMVVGQPYNYQLRSTGGVASVDPPVCNEP